jgi:hypothetical protein
MHRGAGLMQLHLTQNDLSRQDVSIVPVDEETLALKNQLAKC